ncbi:hypothetical protein C0J52_12104 [Blattella germanica]|nr:hypothetical protein C0J52_12104 [Blattella germanica]
MATPQQKAFCVLKFESCKSVITVHAFRRQFNCDPRNANNIHRWHNQLATTGYLCKGKSVVRPRVSEENVDFFLWGFVKDRVYVPPFPANLPELRDRTREAVVAVTPDMLINVWDELAYRLDVCRVTNGARIEHL